MRFKFQLAHELKKYVGEIEDMSYEEYLYWQSYFSIVPFDNERTELMLAQSMALLANINSKKKFKPQDFIPDYWTIRKKTVSKDEFIRKLKALQREGR